jgi:hypothetical protein
MSRDSAEARDFFSGGIRFYTLARLISDVYYASISDSLDDAIMKCN